VRYDGIVLAGGKASRLGGVNKPELTVGGRRLLDIALDALPAAQAVVVVGPRTATARSVSWTREQPIGGGPVAALHAALAALAALAAGPPDPPGASTVVVLAADLPFVTADSVAQLVAARGAGVAAIATDDEGRDQPLLACYDVAALTAALPDERAGASMRSLLERLAAGGSISRVRLEGQPPPTWDCDTITDLNQAEAMT
jgi:molybdenum cofactor guanylyltransferase